MKKGQHWVENVGSKQSDQITVREWGGSPFLTFKARKRSCFNPTLLHISHARLTHKSCSRFPYFLICAPNSCSVLLFFPTYIYIGPRNFSFTQCLTYKVTNKQTNPRANEHAQQQTQILTTQQERDKDREIKQRWNNI